MKAYRIKINTWTSSFRYPNLMSAFQPTLEVPPLSTVMGLINAATGFYANQKEIRLGYYFRYRFKAVDLESIYQISIHKTRKEMYPENTAISNVIQREFLYDCQLFLYLFDEDLIAAFRQPVYQLLLGRSNDLAGIENIKEVELKEKNEAKFAGQVIPFNGNFLPGHIQALPKYFSNSIPRKNIGTEPYSVISCYNPIESKLTGYTPDLKEFDSDIYFHNFQI